jgi:SRSO17 transposase
MREFVTGLAAPLPTRNCWTLAEHLGHPGPHLLQHFLSRASWDDEAVGVDLVGYVRDRLGSGDATLVLDETGDLKKGVETVGVQRQYTGTAGRTENSQVAVYLGYRTAAGYTLIDRELYLPHSWAEDHDRRARAGVPEDVEFATKGALAAAMLENFFAAGGTAAWLTGDEVYGDCPHLREYAEQQELSYVMAIGCNRHLTTAIGHTARADTLVAALSKGRWHPMSAGDGAKGPRLYDWAWIALAHDPDAAPGHRWLLTRRNRTTGELAYYRCFSTRLPRLGTLARVAGRRWSIETNFQHAKTLTGLDEHQVRTWRSWRRWTLLCMLALALLTALATRATPTDPTDTDGLIPLTRNEIRHLNATITRPNHSPEHTLAWSYRRRRHQYQARQSHHQHRQDQAA